MVGAEFGLFSDCGMLQFNGVGWNRRINCCCGVGACQSLKNDGVVLDGGDEVQIAGHSCGHKLGLSIRC